jgi:hypothetical protein
MVWLIALSEGVEYCGYQLGSNAMRRKVVGGSIFELKAV